MKLRIAEIILLLFVLLIDFNHPAFSEPQNHCDDQQSWKQWDALALKYPTDMDVQALHALRIGLCDKVELGTITLEQATDIFERIREAIVKKKKLEYEKDADQKKL